MQENRRLGVRLGGFDKGLDAGESVDGDLAAGREIAHQEPVALLGESGRRRDVDNERRLALFAHLRYGERAGGIEGADHNVDAVIDHPLGLVARDVRIGLDVHVDEIDLVPIVSQHSGSDQRAAVTALACRCKIAGARQQNGDLQRFRLRANDGRGECDRACGGSASQHAAPCRSGFALMCHRHVSIGLGGLTSAACGPAPSTAPRSEARGET